MEPARPFLPLYHWELRFSVILNPQQRSGAVPRQTHSAQDSTLVKHQPLRHPGGPQPGGRLRSELRFVRALLDRAIPLLHKLT